MTATLSPSIVELQAIPKRYYRLMCSVIVKRIAKRRFEVLKDKQRKEELLQDAMAHAWQFLATECVVADDGEWEPKQAAVVAAFRGADRAIEGRALAGEDFNAYGKQSQGSGRGRGGVGGREGVDRGARLVLGGVSHDVAAVRDESAMPLVDLNKLPKQFMPLLRHIRANGNKQEWAKLNGRAPCWATKQWEELESAIRELYLETKIGG